MSEVAIGPADYPQANSPSTAGSIPTWRSKIRRLSITGTILALTGSAFAESPSPESKTHNPPAFEIQVENPIKGNYRLTATITLEAPPLELAKAIVSFSDQCKKGCKIEVPSIDRTEIAHGSFDEGTMATWTVINDILDATYWAQVNMTHKPDTIEIQVASPTPSQLEQWQSKERPHKPFFHLYKNTWSLRADGQTTHIDYNMEMSSNRFLINLMPSQVLKGAEQHVIKLFKHLQSLKAASPSNQP